ncbi:unnamed protein product [Paramecium sonneborni]|uniref:WD domain, G-beta repeat protein n=1 Tax=Paramecium sonneborni TaxID=65129 RepID=A0A8S1Q0B2_9CILI|nr:unnamed protein product [Paramecium sonneborni]
MFSILKSSVEISEQKQFHYELDQQISIPDAWCGSISINSNKLLLFAGCSFRTLIFQFSKQTKLLVSILEENFAISTILLKNNSKEAFKGDCKGNIKITQINGLNNYRFLIKSKEHKDCITQFLISKDEQLFISSSIDGNIKFWNSGYLINCIQTIESNLGSVLGISLNQSENELIACGKKQIILVINKSIINKQWYIFHQIETESYGYRLCYISENAFTFQPNCLGKLQIYQKNQLSFFYNNINEFQVKRNYIDCLFPQQYIQKKSILINKIGNFIYIIKFINQTQILQVQVIDFETYNIYGSISDDAEFLITWDDKTELISIRKLQEI